MGPIGQCSAIAPQGEKRSTELKINDLKCVASISCHSDRKPLATAFETVISGKRDRLAAKQHRIPYTILHARLKPCKISQLKLGSPLMFKATEENVMAEHKFYFQNCFGGYNSLSKDVRIYVCRKNEMLTKLPPPPKKNCQTKN